MATFPTLHLTRMWLKSWNVGTTLVINCLKISVTCVDISIETESINVCSEPAHQCVKLLKCIKPSQLTAHLCACRHMVGIGVCIEHCIAVAVVAFHPATFTVILNVVWLSTAIRNMLIPGQNISCNIYSLQYLWKTRRFWEGRNTLSRQTTSRTKPNTPSRQTGLKNTLSNLSTNWSKPNSIHHYVKRQTGCRIYVGN